MLTVCLGSTCVSQDIQWFDTEEECLVMLTTYAAIPADGDWDTVEYVCKPKGSTGI